MPAAGVARWSSISKAHSNATRIHCGSDNQRARLRAAQEAAGVTFEVTSASELEALDVSMQGDATMHTVEAWEARLAIRRSPSIRSALHEWWTAILRTIGDRFSDGEVPHLDQETFLRVCQSVYGVLDEDADDDEINQEALKDWESDSREGSMTRELFMDSMFEVCVR